MTRVQQSESAARAVGTASARTGAFTLIELLAVMAIIVMLMALIIGAGIFARRAGMRATAKAPMQQIETALQEYKLQNGTYPRYGVTPLAVSYSSISNYLKVTTTKFTYTNDAITDPWSGSSPPYHYYVYILQPSDGSGSYTLKSLGEKAGGEIYPGR